MKDTRLAIIDLDGTLLKGATAERIFVTYLIRTRRLGPFRVLAFLMSFYADILARGFRWAIGNNASYLRGRTPGEVEDWAREFAREFLRNAVPRSLRSKIKMLKESGCQVVLMSGSLQALVDQLQETIQADVLIGGTLEVSGGLLTGLKTGIHPFGSDKLEALFEKIPSSVIDWNGSWALADTVHDLPLFELVGHPVAVNPDRRLRRQAEARGWEIIG